uniref:Protein ITFG3 n=1 Tax=Callorhinchus milii TaxID=7868 RepID=V9KMA4_CALMI
MTENKDLDAEINTLRNEEVRKQDLIDISKRKKISFKNLTRFRQLSRWRTAALFLVLFICLVVVFAFSFIIPCPVRPVSQRTWNTKFEDAVTYPLITLWDVNKDKVTDVLFAFKDMNSSNINGLCITEGLSFPCASVAVLSGTNGSLLWQRGLEEDIQHVQCGIEKLGGEEESSGCLIIGQLQLITAVDSYTGETLWKLNMSFATSVSVMGPALILPDLDGDDVEDFLIFFRSHQQVGSVMELILLLLSGRSGNPIGQLVHHNTSQGFVHFSPLVHITNTGVYYVLFIQGTVQGMALRDLYAKATGTQPQGSNLNQGLLKSDPEWEKMTDQDSRQIEIYRSRTAHYLQRVHVLGNNAGKLLISTSNMIELLDGQNLQTIWSRNTTQIRCPPVPGYFNNDGVFDFLIEDVIEKDRKKVIIVDGNSGKTLWEVELMFSENSPQASSVNTMSRSTFLFWGELATETNSSVIADFTLKKQYLYMVHPSHPSIILELSNSTENVVAFTTALFERSRHACNVLLKGQSVGSEPGTVSITKQNLKEAINLSTVRRLKGNDDFSDEEIKQYFYRMRYSS